MKEKELTLNEYQEKAMRTCMRSSDNFSYMMLNLVGEVGEFASKVAKAIRKKDIGIGLYDEEDNFVYSLDCPMEKVFRYEEEMQKEAGDILWQLSGLCKVMGWDLEDIARMNLAKLASRQERGVIDGSGDNR